MARRILLLVTDLEIGGTPTVVRELAKRLHQPPEVIVDVACLAPWGAVAGQIESEGVRVQAMGARGPANLRIFARLARLITSARYDTLLSFLVHANAAAAVVKPFCPGVRFLQSIQTTQPTPRWRWWLQSVVQPAAERIVVPSPSVAEAAVRLAQVPRERIVIVPNAIDLAQFSFPTRSSTPPQTALPPRVVFIGRLDPVKRIPDLLEALASLPDVRLDIIGDGAERMRIEAMIQELDLGDRVLLHGARAKPQDVLRDADVLVLPSAAEGFGLVLIEAMAAGVPVVATNVPGIRDVVREGVTGLLVPVASPPELAAAIRRVLNDPRLRGDLIRRARADVAQRFTWEVVLPLYRALLELD